MFYHLDSNILINCGRNSDLWEKVRENYLLNFSNIMVSAVAVGEIFSFMEQNR